MRVFKEWVLEKILQMMMQKVMHTKLMIAVETVGNRDDAVDSTNDDFGRDLEEKIETTVRSSLAKHCANSSTKGAPNFLRDTDEQMVVLTLRKTRRGARIFRYNELTENELEVKESDESGCERSGSQCEKFLKLFSASSLDELMEKFIFRKTRMEQFCAGYHRSLRNNLISHYF